MTCAMQVVHMCLHAGHVQGVCRLVKHAVLAAQVRDIIGRNPLVLVGTKMDLLPEGCKPKDVAEWLADAAARRHLNVVSTHLVSSHTGKGELGCGCASRVTHAWPK